MDVIQLYRHFCGTYCLHVFSEWIHQAVTKSTYTSTRIQSVASQRAVTSVLTIMETSNITNIFTIFEVSEILGTAYRYVREKSHTGN